jgi:ribosomal protein L11 methyltransferase
MSRPRRWLVLTVESPSEALTDALAEGLIDLGGSAVQQDGLRLRTFLPPPNGGDEADEVPREAEQAAQRFAQEAAATLGRVADCPAPSVSWAWQLDEDWLALWRAGLSPRRVGEKLIIAPTWTLAAVRAEAGDIVIAIDPKMAFGTGEHASTRGVLRLLERYMTPGAVVLDMGTGSGILAIAAAQLGASAVYAVEDDDSAIENAQENLDRNRAGHVQLECALVDASYLRTRRGHFDVIVANVLSSVLEPLLPAFGAALRPAGVLVLGGILEVEARTLIEASRAAQFAVLAEDREDGWWAAALRVV